MPLSMEANARYPANICLQVQIAHGGAGAWTFLLIDFLKRPVFLLFHEHF